MCIKLLANLSLKEWIFLRKNNIYYEFIKKLETLIPSEQIFLNDSLAKYTTFRIGGPADCLLQPASTAEVAQAITLANHYEIPVTVLGNGSNVLVLDQGIRGLVIRFGDNMSKVWHEKNHIIAGSGAMLADVSRYAADHGLKGMEFAIGIPGSIGGAVYMNAGAYQGEMGCVVSAVTAVCPSGTIRRFDHAESGFAYRHSSFQDNKCLICEVELELELGMYRHIVQQMDEYTVRRETKQPLEMPSAGSTFKRPAGNYAGTLIEQAGLKGLRVGGAEVSQKHAGFIINAGGATAQDVLTLICEVQRKVFAHSGIHLEPEVRVLGDA